MQLHNSQHTLHMKEWRNLIWISPNAYNGILKNEKTHLPVSLKISGVFKRFVVILFYLHLY